MQAVKKFRLQQINGLQSHTARYGPLKQSESSRPSLPNPFLPLLNPHTGKWRPPKYSLRRQAELVKMAKISNTLHLLPPGPKFAALDHAVPPIADEHVASTSEAPSEAAEGGAWLATVEWQGKFKSKVVSGAEIGSRLYAAKKRMFKGHRWERVLEKRKKKRVILMRDMAKRVESYKAVSVDQNVSARPCTDHVPLQYYHRRKPNPLKPARSAKAPKLPF